MTWFTAIKLSQDISRNLQNFRLPFEGAVWSNPQDFHITLRQLGTQELGTLNEATRAAFFAELINADPGERFSLELKGISWFDRTNKGHSLLWAKVAAGTALQTLHQQHDSMALQCGFPTRPWPSYRPHVTLAYGPLQTAEQKSRFEDHYAEHHFGEMEVTEVHVLHGVNQWGGPVPRYETVKTLSLR